MSRYRRLRQAQIASQGGETCLVRRAARVYSVNVCELTLGPALAGCRLAAFATGGRSPVRIRRLLVRAAKGSRSSRSSAIAQLLTLRQPAPHDVCRCLRRHLHCDGRGLASGRDLSHRHGWLSVWTRDRRSRSRDWRDRRRCAYISCCAHALGEPLLRRAGPRARQLARGFATTRSAIFSFCGWCRLFPFSWSISFPPSQACISGRCDGDRDRRDPRCCCILAGRTGLDSVIAAQRIPMTSAWPPEKTRAGWFSIRRMRLHRS